MYGESVYFRQQMFLAQDLEDEVHPSNNAHEPFRNISCVMNSLDVGSIENALDALKTSVERAQDCEHESFECGHELFECDRGVCSRVVRESRCSLPGCCNIEENSLWE